MAKDNISSAALLVLSTRSFFLKKFILLHGLIVYIAKVMIFKLVKENEAIETHFTVEIQ